MRKEYEGYMHFFSALSEHKKEGRVVALDPDRPRHFVVWDKDGMEVPFFRPKAQERTSPEAALPA